MDNNANIHLNKPQIKALMVGATDEVGVWGRGTGKSEGRIAYRIYNNCVEMPRSGGAMVGASYMQLLDRTLPPIIKTWQAWGLKRDSDFWIRRFPPKNKGLNFPLWCPETAEHAVFLRIKNNVSVIHLIGQDRIGTSNSKSIDWIVGDEAKLLNFDRMENETYQANRGNNTYFGNCSLHHGICYTTDMPTDPRILKKLLQFEEAFLEPGNQDKINMVLALQIKIYQEQIKKKPDMAKLQKMYGWLNELRKRTTFFSEASTLENVEVLGMEFIKKLKRILPDFIYRTSILNLRPGIVEMGFYPGLRDYHFTYAINYSFVDKFDPEGKRAKDCRRDSDILKGQPLIIAPDWGGHINTLAIGQQRANGRVRGLNEMYVLHPETIKELCKQFSDYYRHLPHRDVVLVYDHTALGTDAKSPLNNVETMITELSALKWNVIDKYIGHTPDAKDRHNLWHKAFAGDDPEVPGIDFNAENVKYSKISMEICQIKEDQAGFRKNKNNERDKNFDQRGHHTSQMRGTICCGIAVLLWFQGR